MKPRKKVVITGASGVLGRYLLQSAPGSVELVLLGREKKEIFPGFETVSTNYECSELVSLFQGVDTVIHLAAQRLYGGEDCSNNALIDDRVFGAAKESHVSRVVFLSTCAVDEYDLLPASELSAMKPATDYARNKIKSEENLSFIAKNKFEFVVLRLAQLLALGEYQGSALSVFLEKSLKKEAIVLSVNESNFREYIYAKDAADAIWKVVCSCRASGTFNLGSGYGCSIPGLARAISEVFEAPDPVFRDDLSPFFSRVLMNSEKFYDYFGWKPKWTVKEALFDLKNELV